MVLPYTPCTKEWANNVHSTDCIIYVPDGRYQYLLPDGSRSKSSCNFETCLILIVPFKCGNVIVNYERFVMTEKLTAVIYASTGYGGSKVKREIEINKSDYESAEDKDAFLTEILNFEIQNIIDIGIYIKGKEND